ncbi:DUF3572 family protein [Jiella sp. 40Bstr34]|uniref:DUF3572 family protein n=1 Tax=Jiella pacifica TaxID=2696469 RepID=A0A6N9T5F6_9HYPH|nr:DUF3572 domain-containing protein [Jiella pacifica]NDW06521.1 DUF3572 family protein [Jiella pacifica]
MREPAAGRAPLGREKAESIAIEGLTFIAADPVLWPRFLAVTGLDQSQLRDAARAAGFLPGVLDFILAHQPTLESFCEAQQVSPQSVSAARHLLTGPEDLSD